MSEPRLIRCRDDKDYYFLPSEYVKIFPSSYRGREVTIEGKDTITNTGLNIESKLSTEYNFRHLSSSYSRKSYINSISINDYNIAQVDCCVNGYHIIFNIVVSDLAEVKYITLDTINTNIVEGDTQTTDIVKNKIIELLASSGNEDIPENSHYLDTNITPKGEPSPTLCFGGISFYKQYTFTGNEGANEASYLPLFKTYLNQNHYTKRYVDLIFKSGSIYSINTTVLESLKFNLSGTNIDVPHIGYFAYESSYSMPDREQTNYPIVTNIVDGEPENSIIMNGCDVRANRILDGANAANSFAGGNRSLIQANSSLTFGDDNIIDKFDPYWYPQSLTNRYPTAQIILGASNRLNYSRYDDDGNDIWGKYPQAYVEAAKRIARNSTAIGHDLIAIDDQIVIGRGITQKRTRIGSTQETKITGNILHDYTSEDSIYDRPYFIVGNSGSVLEIQKHDVYITGCTYNSSTGKKTFDGSLTVCGLSKFATGSGNTDDAIKLNESGKLVRFTPSTTLEDKGKGSMYTEYTTSFLSALKQDSVGNITVTEKTFTLSSTIQGQILLNNGNTSYEGATINIPNLGTTGTPTFSTITTSGKATVKTLEVSSTTASASTPDLVCKGNASIEKGLSVTGTTSFVGSMYVKLNSSESTNAIAFTKVSNERKLTLNCPVIANNNITLNAPLQITTGRLDVNGIADTDGIFSNKDIGTDAGLYAAKVGSDYKFQVTSTGNVTAESYTATSDKRLKENIIEYKPKKSILDLPIYKYDFINGTKNQIGCLAQDLKEICPEIVTENENGYLGIQESKLIYLLIDEVKKLKEKIK